MVNIIGYRGEGMTVQRFEEVEKATKEEIAEAEALIKGLRFTKTVYCCDGYESWENTVTNIDAFVELIRRARGGL